MLGRKYSRGDTIIEVVIAFTVFSLLAVGALAIMNQGTSTAQKALEITLVRQQIDAQAEALRYIHSSYIDARVSGDTSSPAIADWQKITTQDPGKARPKTTADFGTTDGGKCLPIPDNAFFINAHTGVVEDSKIKSFEDTDLDATTPPYSQVFYENTATNIAKAAYGLWIESVRQNNNQNYVDFHIRACWYAPGEGPATTLGTIVRLYVPAN